MKIIRDSVMILVAVLLVGSTFGQTSLRMATVHPDTHPFTIGLRHFAEQAATLTDGNVRVEVYPAGQLGNERDLAEGVEIGTIDGAVVTTAVVSSFVPEYELFSLPFLFSDEDHLHRVLAGPVGDKYTALLNRAGMDLWGYWVVGGRGIYSKKPVNSVSDVAGMKIRTLENPVVLATWNRLGASPTPLPWGDVYTALQSGVVDAAEGSKLGLITAQHGEVVDYFTDLQYIISGNVVILSDSFLSRIDEETNQQLRQAMDSASEEVRRVFAERNAEMVQQVQEQYGVTVIEIDVTPFQELVAELYSGYDQADIDLIIEAR